MESSEHSSDEQEAIKTENNSPSSENSGKDSTEGKCKGTNLFSTSGQQISGTATSHGLPQERTSSKVIGTIVLVISIATLYLTKTYVQPNARQISSMPTQVTTMVKEWESTFPNLREDVWSIIEGQIVDFMEQESAPLIFVFSYKEGDEQTVKKISSVVSQFAVQLKHREDVCGDREESKLRGNDPNIKEKFLVSVLPMIQKCKKMTVYNLEEMPPEAAQDLHSLLDVDNPNVKCAVYIFTVKFPAEANLDLYWSVSDMLKKRWSSKLSDDYIAPIISRLVNFIDISTP